MGKHIQHFQLFQPNKNKSANMISICCDHGVTNFIYFQRSEKLTLLPCCDRKWGVELVITSSISFNLFLLLKSPYPALLKSKPNALMMMMMGLLMLGGSWSVWWWSFCEFLWWNCFRMMIKVRSCFCSRVANSFKLLDWNSFLWLFGIDLDEWSWWLMMNLRTIEKA